MSEDEELLISQVPRSLDLKSKLFGLEIGDLILVFLNLAAQNLIFGQTSIRALMVWGTTLLLGFSLFIFKRGKPDRYLFHLAEFLLMPAVLSAALADLSFVPFETKNGEP